MSNDVTRIKEAVDFVSLVGEFTPLHPSGKDFRGRCPFHNGDSTSAFVVHPDTKTYRCFRCDAAGDVFDFVKHLNDLGFRESLELLADRCGITLAKSTAPPRSPVERVLEEAVSFWRDQLLGPDGEPARAYLLSRGIAEHLWRPAGIGFCPNPQFRTWAHLHDKGFADKPIQASGIYNDSRYTQLADKIVIPIRTDRKISNLYGRAIGIVPSNERHRYTGSHSGLYGLDQVAEGEPVVVVEGIIDALALRSAGIRQVVATYGTSGLNDDAITSIVDRHPSRVVLFFDGDGAGRAAAKSAGRRFADQGCDYRLVLTPEGEDPATLVTGGADVAFLVETAGSLADITARQIVRKLDPTTAADRIHLGYLLDELSAAGMGPLQSQVVIHEVAEILGLPESQILFQFNRRAGVDPPAAPKGTSHVASH